MDVAKIRHSTLKVGPVTVFYREAGLEGRPILLLLHGFANSSHYFRHLMPLLANHFHLIAPDLPSFGFTQGGCGSLSLHLRTIDVRREKALILSGGKSRPGTGSLHPVAIGAVAKVTKPLEPPV